MENVQLTKEQLEELLKQELEVTSEGSIKSKELQRHEKETRQFKELLMILDETPLTSNEEEPLNKYREECQILLKETRLPIVERFQLLQFSRALVLLRDVDSDVRNSAIRYGIEIAHYIANRGSAPVKRLFQIKEKVIIDWSKFKSAVLWSILFPGEPYNEIEEALSQSEYRELKNRWWMLHVEKWRLIEAFCKGVGANKLIQNKREIQGAVKKKKEESEKQFKLHLTGVAKAVNNVIESSLLTDFISEKGNLESHTLHRIHRDYKQKGEISKYTLRNWIQHEEKREKLEQERKTLTKENT